MDTFKSVDEVWSHCLYCPVCQANTRTITSEIDSKNIECISSKKDGGKLYIRCEYNSIYSQHDIAFNIDCSINTFDVDILSTDFDFFYEKQDLDQFLYITLNSQCRGCNQSRSLSNSLKFNLVNKKISNIGIDRDTIWLYSVNDNYHITRSYFSQTLIISRLSEDVCGFFKQGKTIFLPSVNLDFSDKQKVFDKIKTLVLFS